jgi:hypothetical protein
MRFTGTRIATNCGQRYKPGKVVAANIEIMCINKTTPQCLHERIRRLLEACIPDGSSWMLSQPQAIAEIDACKANFFVSTDNQVVRVVVATTSAGHKYLKTEHDDEHPDTLLSLPENPRGCSYTW